MTRRSILLSALFAPLLRALPPGALQKAIAPAGAPVFRFYEYTAWVGARNYLFAATLDLEVSEPTTLSVQIDGLTVATIGILPGRQCVDIPLDIVTHPNSHISFSTEEQALRGISFHCLKQRIPAGCQ